MTKYPSEFNLKLIGNYLAETRITSLQRKYRIPGRNTVIKQDLQTKDIFTSNDLPLMKIEFN